MMNWEHYLYVLAGVVSTHVWIWIKNSYMYRYKWACPDCNFIARSSSPSVITTVKMIHTH
jgi:hypothetical protein